MDDLSFIKRFFSCLAKIGFYKMVVREKTRKAVFYGIILALSIGSLTMISPVVQFGTQIDQIIGDIQDSAPEFKIVGGTLTGLKEPYAVSGGIVALVLDSSTKSTVQKDAPIGIFFLKDRLSIHSSTQIIQEQSYKTFVTGDFTKSSLVEMMGALKLFFWIMLPFGALFSCAGLFASSVVAMFMGVFIFKVQKKKLSYRDSYVIGIYAHTLPWLVCLIASVFMIPLPLFYVMNLVLVALIYFQVARWKGTVV